MPMDFRDFEAEIKAKGYSLQLTRKGHYWVVTPRGGKLVLFAVSHKENSRGEVFSSYVTIVRRAISNDQRAK